MARSYCYADFEFNRVSSPQLNMVAAAVKWQDKVYKWWLFNDGQKRSFLEFIQKLPPEVIFVSYNVESEARSFISLGLDPRKYKWQCLYLEYLMMMNHNHEIAYGKHLIDGQVRRLRPYVDEKGKASLAGALWKMCEVKVDTEHKTTMRNLIISDPEVFSNEDRKAILDYAGSDVEYLPQLQRAIANYMIAKLPKKELPKWFNESLLRADYAVETAWMVTHGYPIRTEWARNLTDNIEPLLDACVRDINSQFEGEYQPFRFDKKSFRWVQNQAVWRKWIRDNKLDKGWPLTDGGKSGKKDLSLSLDAWTARFAYTHTYPRDNYGAQIVRFLKLKQSLGGFREKAGKDKKTFWEYVGNDGRVRPYFNIYGAQSSRTQPSATGYIFLKPAWQRTLVHPPKGKMIVGIDYSSQEFLLSALFSGDKKMIDAYRSGDVYLAFGKLIGLIPPNGTKATHKFQRDACKATVLGLSYLMTKYGLAIKLTTDTGKVWTEDQAQEQVDAFDEAFEVFSEFRQDEIDRYRDTGYTKLKDGWYMFQHNHNDRSVSNMPIQGAGGDIMRRSVIHATRTNGLKVTMTLHDAAYIECDLNDWEAVDLFIDSMTEGFTSYFKDTPQYEESKMIRLDTYAWGDGLPETEIVKGKIVDKSVETPKGREVTVYSTYIDERAVEEFEHFKSFFFENSGLDAL